MKKVKKFCDLHIHSTFSDGDFSIDEILKMCEEENLSAISITDHDNVDSCFYLEKLDIKKYFSGTIIYGCEIRCMCDCFPIEILAYGIDPYKLKPILEKNKITLHTDDEIKTKLLYENFRKLDSDYYYPIESLNPLTTWCYKALYEDGHKNSKILAKLKEEKIDGDVLVFLRKGLGNPKSQFYCDLTKYYISAPKLVKLIHACGGLAFVAHPIEYRENYQTILNILKDKIDGIECYHPSAGNHLEDLKKFAEKHNLLISGGSDFHGYKGKINSENIKVKECANLFKKLL